MVYEDGVRYRFNNFAPHYLATAGLMNWVEEHKCHWLMDVLASYNIELSKRNADYLKIVEVKLNSEGGCTFTITDEINGLLIKQEIEYTDLDEDIKFWAIDEGKNVICMLPSEY